MAGFLGLDTSNYTTSAAILDPESGMLQRKLPLPVAQGAVGLRQSDAVFSHIKQVGPLVEQLFDAYGGVIAAIGVSSRPCDADGSYMPCFLAGEMAARSVAAALGAPVYELSHQAGHIAAALYDTGLTALFEQEFLAFHVSGGTTQALLVRPDTTGERPFEIMTVAQSLDLHAGQLVDRIGVMLGIAFPAGPELEKLALQSKISYKIPIAFKGGDCCLSGFENQCRRMLDSGEKPQNIAKYCISAIETALVGMTERVLGKYPGRKLVYAGGVMSCSIIRDSVKSRFDAAFASPAFSADNAAGIAVLCERMFRREAPA